MELAWKYKTKTLSFEIVCNTNSTVRKGAVSSLVKVKSTQQQQPDEEKSFLPNPNSVIDPLCSLPSRAATRSPQQESFLDRLGKQQPGKESHSCGAPTECFWSDSPQVTHLSTGQGNYRFFCAWDLAKEEVNYSLCQATRNPHRIVLNSHL